MQGLSGSLGVVLTVPVTAFIAAFLIGRKGKNYPRVQIVIHTNISISHNTKREL